MKIVAVHKVLDLIIISCGASLCMELFGDEKRQERRLSHQEDNLFVHGEPSQFILNIFIRMGYYCYIFIY